jgi:hypothetical protein
LVFNIVNFNVDHFARLNLNITTEAFSTNYRIMRVEGLPDTSSALDYLNHFVSSEEVLAEAGKMIIRHLSSHLRIMNCS